MLRVIHVSPAGGGVRIARLLAAVLCLVLAGRCGAEAVSLSRVGLRHVARSDIPGAREVALYGDWAWVAQNLQGLTLVNIRRPSRPHIVRRFAPAEVQALDVTVAGPGLLAIADRFRGLRLWDITRPTAPAELATVALPGIPNHLSVYQHESGSRYLIASCGGSGFAVVDITSARNARLVSHYQQEIDFARRSLTAGRLGYLADHHDGGLKVFDLRNPAAPILMTGIRLSGFCESVALDGDLLYCGYRQYGTRIFRVTPDAADASTTPTLDLVSTVYRSQNRVRDIALPAEGLLVLADDEAGVALYDVSRPQMPHLISEYRFDRQRDGVASSLAVHRNVIYVPSWEGGLHVFEIREE